MLSYSLYLHIPFCRHRCAYCDFNTYSGLDHLISDYVAALCAEIEWLGDAAEQRLPVHTVFFGGGTPSLLSVASVEQILLTIDKHFSLSPGAEITLEANPGTVSLEYWQELYRTGINRLSLGLQSADANELMLLERQHDFTDAVRAVRWARKAGFDNLNLDLIYGLPYQTVDRWQRTLNMVLGLGVEHMSLYALSLEHGTPMHKWVNHGLLPEPDADLAADMYEYASEKLEKAGYVQYEISNWAVSNEDGSLFACRHNLQYWRLMHYIGLGAGAHGFLSGVHTATVLSPGVYIQRLQTADKRLPFPSTPATASVVHLSQKDEMGEVMLMGLRLVREGVSDDAFRARFHTGLFDAYGDRIEHLVAKGLLEWHDGCLRLTPGGRLLGNQVFVEFVDG